MNATRRFSIAALVVACMHLVFGAIVRISGSGMGCGDNWPKCYGHWFPPFNRPDLIVEVSHRYLASILTLTVLAMAFTAWRHRNELGVGGKGGAMRSAFGAVGAVFTAAILGGVTVKMGNAPWATVAHWLVAMTLLAMVATTAIRSGALGGASAAIQRGSAKTARGALGAAALAIFAVALGGLTAKLPGAAVGCTTIPMCGANPSVEQSSIHVQITHRTIAVILVLHLIGMVLMLRKRRATEAPVVVRAASVALGMVLLQLVVASSMILFHLPPVLRSLHEATGVGIWLSCFALAYLARRASRIAPGEPAKVEPAAPSGSMPGSRGFAPTRGASAQLAEEGPSFSAIAAPVATIAVAPTVEETPHAERGEESPVQIFESAAVTATVAEHETVLPPEPKLTAEQLDPSIAIAALELTRDDRVEDAELAKQEEESLVPSFYSAAVEESVVSIPEAVAAAEVATVVEVEANARATESEPATKIEDPAVALAAVELAQDDVVAAEPLELAQEDVVTAEPLTVDPSRDDVDSELDWEPTRPASKSDELDEFSIAAIEAELAAMEADLQAEVKRDEAQAAEETKSTPTERVAGDASLVTPPVAAPKLSPLPPPPTMAVIVARGADLL